MYFYENHMGGIYTSDDELSYEDTYCETCGDSDNLIGDADTIDEAWNLLKDKIDREITPDDEEYEKYLDENGKLICTNTGGYDREYIANLLNSIEWN